MRPMPGAMSLPSRRRSFAPARGSLGEVADTLNPGPYGPGYPLSAQGPRNCPPERLPGHESPLCTDHTPFSFNRGTPYYFLAFGGRPGLPGRRSRPRRRDNFFRNASSPSGRAVLSLRRMAAANVFSSVFRKYCRQLHTQPAIRSFIGGHHTIFSPSGGGRLLSAGPENHMVSPDSTHRPARGGGTSNLRHCPCTLFR